MSILKSKIAKLALKLQLKHREYIEQPNTNDYGEKLMYWWCLDENGLIWTFV